MADTIVKFHVDPPGIYGSLRKDHSANYSSCRRTSEGYRPLSDLLELTLERLSSKTPVKRVNMASNQKLRAL